MGLVLELFDDVGIDLQSYNPKDRVRTALDWCSTFKVARTVGEARHLGALGKCLIREFRKGCAIVWPCLQPISCRSSNISAV